MKEETEKLKITMDEITKKMGDNGIPRTVIEDFLNKINTFQVDNLWINSKESDGIETVTITTKDAKIEKKYTLEINPAQQKYEIATHSLKYDGPRIVYDSIKLTALRVQKDDFVIFTTEDESFEKDYENRIIQNINTKYEEFYDQTGVETHTEFQSKTSTISGERLKKDIHTRYPFVSGDILKTTTIRISPDLLSSHSEKYPGGYKGQKPKITNSYLVLRGEHGSLASFHQSNSAYTEKEFELSQYSFTQGTFDQKTQYDSPEQKQSIIRWGRGYNISTGKSR